MARDEQIYVGYRAMGPAHKRFTQIVVLAILVVGAWTGAMLSAAMRPAGTGRWDTSHTGTETGVIRMDPYPFLETPEGPILLAEPGKFGAQKPLSDKAGREARITGTALSRGNRRALEIDTLEMLGENESPTPLLEFVSNVIELRGEILDSKCFLGAMKPGDGAMHKSCAMQCLRGGITPLFVGEDSKGKVVDAVLCLPDLAPIGEDLIGYAGEPVTVRGRLARLGMLELFVLEPGSVRRESD